MTYPRALLAALALACAGEAGAQTELERLGGGPGGVPQWPGSARTFFNERSGERPRPRRPRQAPSPAAPAPAPAPVASPADEDDTEITWRSGLITAKASRVPASQFFLEFHQATGISVRLDPGAPSHVTANVHGMRLATALSLMLPKDSYRLVRRENVPLNAPDAFVGLVVGPAPAAPHEDASGGKPVIGPVVIGPAFAVPGEAPHVDRPAIAVEEGPETGARSPETSDQPPAAPLRTPDSGLRTSDSSRRIAELLESRQNKRR